VTYNASTIKTILKYLYSIYYATGEINENNGAYEFGKNNFPISSSSAPIYLTNQEAEIYKTTCNNICEIPSNN
jgi:hypothetical protein